MYTFFILILFIPILHTATRSEYGLQKFGKLSKLARFSRFSRLNDFGRLGRASGEPSNDPQIFSLTFTIVQSPILQRFLLLVLIN